MSKNPESTADLLVVTYRAALQAAAEEFNRISCEGVTETRNVSDALDRAKAFADRGAVAVTAALRASPTDRKMLWQQDADNAEAGAKAVREILSPAPAELLVGYQERVAAAHHALFHDDPTDIAERLARYAEETNEVLQAFGMSREFMHQLVDYTCDRPAGEPAKEIGAALLTLTSLCVVAGYDVMACGEADLEKLQRPETIARIRAKRATRHGRGPLPGFDPSASAEVEG